MLQKAGGGGASKGEGEDVPAGPAAGQDKSSGGGGDGATLLEMLRAGTQRASQQAAGEGERASSDGKTTALLPTPGSAGGAGDAPAASSASATAYGLYNSHAASNARQQEPAASSMATGASITDFRFDVAAIMREYALAASTAVRT